MQAESLVWNRVKKIQIQFENPETDSDPNYRFCLTLCDDFKG